MIRYIYIGDQVYSGDNLDNHSFAFYDTATDRFMEFDGDQVFENIEEFRESYCKSKYADKSGFPIERFLSLIRVK